MKAHLLSALILVALAAPCAADDSDLDLSGILDLLDRDPTLSPPLQPTLQLPPPPSSPGYPPRGVLGAPRRPRLQLFPGPKLLSLDLGLSWAPLVGGGAADEQTPHLAAYRKYWDWQNGWGLHANLHLHVLPTADAYIGIGAYHYSSNGKRDWFTYQGPNEIKIRYGFDPLYIFPVEFGGKGYLPLKAPPGLRFLDPNRAAPMLYLRIGAGPALVNRVKIKYKRYVNGSLQSELDEDWWPFQSVLNVHVSVGFEWGSFRTKKGVPLGLFIEAGYRVIWPQVVTEFTDTSDPMQHVHLTIGVHFP
jgi:hypothetical protein